MISKEQYKADMFDNLLNALDQRVGESDDSKIPFHEWPITSKLILDGRPFSFKKHEYLYEPYKDMHPFQVEIKATQLGLTSKAMLKVFWWARYGGDKYKGIGYYFPSRTDVTDLSKARLSPLIEDNPDTIGSWMREVDAANVKRIWNSSLYLRGMKSRVGMKCHSETTEVLTKDGWKLFKEVTMDDMFATLDKKCNIKYQKPIEIYSYAHKGNMYSFVIEDINLCVTGNHRLLLVCGNDRTWIDAGVANKLEFKPNLYTIDGTFRVLPLSATEEYNGYVYCASVPAGILCTRIGNSVGVWSGNSAPMDAVVFDELDEAPQNSVDMIMERMAHSEAGELLFLSNPTLPDYGIDRLFLSTDQQYFLLKCPACNEYTDMVGTFPDCLHTLKGGRVIRACIKCGKELDPAKGEWVAKRPSITERRGRQFSQLYAQTKMTDPTLILEKFHSTQNLTDFYNLKLGLAYVDAQNRLTKQEVFACCGDQGMVSESDTACFMGVDQGKNLHVVIGRKHKNKMGEVIYVGVHKGNNTNDKDDESGWKELDALMKRFKVGRCVVDAMPSKKNARNFADRFRGRVYLNFYNPNQKGSYKWNEKEMIVQCDRTESLDKSHSAISNLEVILPRQSEMMDDFAKQCTNIAKRLITNEDTGSSHYEYIAVGDREDHFRHSFNYMLMGLSDAPDLLFDELL